MMVVAKEDYGEIHPDNSWNIAQSAACPTKSAQGVLPAWNLHWRESMIELGCSEDLENQVDRLHLIVTDRKTQKDRIW